MIAERGLTGKAGRCIGVVEQEEFKLDKLIGNKVRVKSNRDIACSGECGVITGFDVLTKNNGDMVKMYLVEFDGGYSYGYSSDMLTNP
jgi:hypothetical protein